MNELSVGVKPAMSASCASYACTSVPIAKPKKDLALEPPAPSVVKSASYACTVVPIAAGA